jgi:hypothetical protein
MVRAITLLAVLGAAAPALAGGDEPYEKTEDRWSGGLHWRIVTENGPVHVWIPPGYDRDTAGVVYYLHGHKSSADDAWKNHHLSRQFKKSRQNAMFIVPEAQSSSREQVHWKAMSDLRKAISRRGRIRVPDGPVVVIGHSGAFGTLNKWLDNRNLEEVILLDALWAYERLFADFIHSGKRSADHKMIIVGIADLEKSKKFAGQFKYSVFRDRLPADYSGFSKRERNAKLLFIRSQYSHMGMVTNEKVIPMLLRLTRLGKIGQAKPPAPLPAPPVTSSSVQ